MWRRVRFPVSLLGFQGAKRTKPKPKVDTAQLGQLQPNKTPHPVFARFPVFDKQNPRPIFQARLVWGFKPVVLLEGRWETPLGVPFRANKSTETPAGRSDQGELVEGHRGMEVLAIPSSTSSIQIFLVGGGAENPREASCSGK